MLKKLLKHDFRALGRTLWPTNLAVAGAGVIMAVLLNITLRFGESDRYTSGAKAVFTVVTGMPLVLIGLAVLASAFLTLVFVSYHYYQNLMGDEGYLTFTLPVTSTQILWSKLMTGFAFIAINTVAILFAIIVVLIFGTSTKGLINANFLEVFQGFPVAWSQLSSYLNAPLLAVETVVSMITGLAAQLLKIYFAVTIGGMIAKKHKLLAAIGMYFAINIAMGFVGGIFRLVFGVGMFFTGAATTVELTGAQMMNSTLLYGIGTSLAFSVLFFLLTRLILKKHLNLQ